MKHGLKYSTSRFAITAALGICAAGFGLEPASAADLGGDCCADLEERVAELEATTVRKGNRKVSVKLSGQVNRAIMFWDDGVDNDVYFVDYARGNSRFRITGSAKISPGRTAGFRIEADWFTQNNSTLVSNCDLSTLSSNNQHCRALANVIGDRNSTATGVTDMRWTEVWIKDKTWGKVSLGQGDTATNNTSHVDLSGTRAAQGANMLQAGRNFVFRTTTGLFTTIELRDVYNDHDGLSRRNRLRYDTPSFGGFTFSTSVGADDFIDGALRFKKEWNSVRCAWAGGIAHDTNENNRVINGVVEHDDQWIYSTSGSCAHTPSGLSLTLGYSETDEGVDDADQQWYFVKVGISRRWNSHGKTGISFQYARNNDRLSTASTDLQDELDSYGIAVQQNIDSAAMQLYAAWYHHQLTDNRATSYEDLSFFLMGAKMKF